MSSDLLNKFIDEECTEAIRTMLISEIEDLVKNNTVQLKEYTFNRFNLYLNFVEKKVKIEDELDVEESGVLIVDLDYFLISLGP